MCEQLETGQGLRELKTDAFRPNPRQRDSQLNCPTDYPHLSRSFGRFNCL